MPGGIRMAPAASARLVKTPSLLRDMVKVLGKMQQRYEGDYMSQRVEAREEPQWTFVIAASSRHVWNYWRMILRALILGVARKFHT
jgi:hypothetical protein